MRRIYLSLCVVFIAARCLEVRTIARRIFVWFQFSLTREVKGPGSEAEQASEGGSGFRIWFVTHTARTQEINCQPDNEIMRK